VQVDLRQWPISQDCYETLDHLIAWTPCSFLVLIDTDPSRGLHVWAGGVRGPDGFPPGHHVSPYMRIRVTLMPHSKYYDHMRIVRRWS
jgi:hypothetical protein